MKQYQVNGQVTVSAYTYVWAKSKAEALRFAEERSTEPVLAGYGSPDECFVVEYADGEVLKLEVEAV